MPATKAVASAAVHAAVAAVSWARVQYTVEVAYTRDEVDTGRVEIAVDHGFIFLEVPRTGVSFAKTVHAIRAELVPDTTVRASDVVRVLAEIRFSLACSRADVVSVLEAFARALTYSRSFSDSVGTADSVTATLVLLRNFADAVSTLDARVTALSLSKADTVVAAEAMAKSLNRALADVVIAQEAVTEDLLIQDIDKLVVETLTVADVFAATPGKGLADSVVVLDSRSAVSTKALADSASTLDVRAADVAQLLADSFTTADLFAFNWEYERVFSCDEVSSLLNAHMLHDWPLHVDDQCEHVILGDGVVFIYDKPLGDSATAVEAFSRSIIPATVADGVTASDSPAKSFIKGTLAEIATVSDAPLVFTHGRVIAESVVATDVSAKVIARGTISESVVVVDSRAVSFTVSPPAVVDPCHMLLLGTTGSIASAPDSPANRVTGDIEIVIKAAANDWSVPAGRQFIFSKFTEGADQRAWIVDLEPQPAGNMQVNLFISTTGADLAAVGFTGSAPFVNTQPGWLRLKRVRSTGAATCEASPDGSGWTVFGVPNQPIFAGASIFASNQPLVVGALRYPGGNEPFAGKIYHAELRSVIGGPAVAVFEASGAPTGSTSFVAVTGETWTLSGTASIVCPPFAEAVRSSDVVAIALTKVFADPVVVSEVAVFSGIGLPELNENALNETEIN